MIYNCTSGFKHFFVVSYPCAIKKFFYDWFFHNCLFFFQFVSVYHLSTAILDLQRYNVATFERKQGCHVDSVSSQNQLDLVSFFGLVQTLLHKTSELNL